LHGIDKRGAGHYETPREIADFISRRALSKVDEES
jgi:hypothetical protein